MKFNRPLKQDLTQEKRDEYGKYIVDVLDLVEDLEEQKKATSARYKVQIEDKLSSLREYRNAIRSGYEMINVDCDEVMDWDNDRVNIIRLDTQETIDDRPITDIERQMRLDEQQESEQPTEDGDDEKIREADGADA